MTDLMVRIEEKVDQTNSDVRELIRAIHEQSVAMVRLTEQMKNSQEAVDRAHKRIDTVSGKVEELHDLPLRVAYMEKNIASIEQKQVTAETHTISNVVDLAKSAGVRSVLNKWGIYIFFGLLVVGLAAVGKIG